MSTLIDSLRAFNAYTVILRLTLSAILGGLIGIEREQKRRPAGFRTHIITCVGSALTMLTSQYLISVGYNTDIGRMGAQVIVGIGFIGAGTIVVTRNRKVRGLTTAAGFWASAVIGLATGSGYYEGAVIGTALILISELVLSKFERHIIGKSNRISLIIGYNDEVLSRNIVSSLTDCGAEVLKIEITSSPRSFDERSACAIYTLLLPRGCDASELREAVLRIKGVTGAEIIQ